MAEVSEEPRLVMTFQGREIVNMSRAFLGYQRCARYSGCSDRTREKSQHDPFDSVFGTILLDNLRKENVASQIGLAEMFDASIGKSSVLMPFGGKYQLTETEGSVQKLPVFGFTNTCSIMTHGFHPANCTFLTISGCQLFCC